MKKTIKLVCCTTLFACFLLFGLTNSSVVQAAEDAETTSDSSITLSIDPAEVTVEQARMVTLQLLCRQGDGQELDLVAADQAEWKSTNTSISTVFQGQVTGVRTGKTTITAKYKEQTAQAEITVVPPAKIEKTGPVHSFFELVSNIGLFNFLLESYDLGELQVCLPEKVIKHVEITTTEFATDFDITTSSEVRKITIRSRGHSYEAIMESSGHWKRGVAGLRVGDEVTIKAYTGSNKQLQQLIFRLKKGI